MSSEAVPPQPNVVSRVINLPLVSSTYCMVSSAYTHTKENHPYWRSLCEVAEQGVLTVTAVAMTSAKPIIQKMEPQIAVANGYACMGLDKIEEKLPILYQPSDKIVSRASDMVTSAKDTLTTRVNDAKELVGRTKEAVHESVAMTKAVVNGSINTVLESHVVQTVNDGVDTVLTKSENFIDQYLPLTEDELAKEAANVEGFEVGGQKPNYYVRLGSLSSKVRRRAFQQAVGQLRDVKSRSLDVISQLHATIDVMEFTRKNMNSANKKLKEAQEKLYQSWLEWSKSTGHDGEVCASTEDVESRTLVIARNLTKHLQTTCIALVSNLHGLPHNLQEQAHHMTTTAADLYQNFHLASSFREVSDNGLGSTRGQLDRIKGCLDHMVDYVTNSPLNWLVGPFYPQLSGSHVEPDGGYEIHGEEEM